MTTFAAICLAVAALALVGAGINVAVTAYWTRQTTRILAGLPEQPKPWYVRVFDKVFP